jgi:hypothetical protein
MSLLPLGLSSSNGAGEAADRPTCQPIEIRIIAMRENVITAPPEVQDEISRALNVLKKGGYTVKANEGSSGELALDFRFGATEQILRFAKDEWRNKGVVEKRIIDKLEI